MNHLPDTISLPQDLRTIPPGQLPDICSALRDELIDTISKTGGHFAANLGVIELTVALHYVCNTPHDEVIWDVGHQSYPHKMLTGRKHLFDHLRKKGGISGFPKRTESEYDVFGTGHSSTSLSAIAGLCMAARQQGVQKNHVAIIGDGALSGGQAFEALNHIGHLQLPVIVILNDNQIGIDPSTGALGNRLGQLQTQQPNFFTDLGFEYYGPVDGHDVITLVHLLKERIPVQRPLLLHMTTVKGKGYSPAEFHQTAWHATGKFDKINPTITTAINPSEKYQDIAGKTLLKLAHQHPLLVAITPAMVSGSSLHFMQEAYPDRVFDVGIAEQHAITFAGGLAAGGVTPFCFIYSTFLQRGVDQLIHDVCLQSLPVIFCIDRAGIVGEDGPTHHGLFDLPILRSIPGIVVASPSCREELEQMMLVALHYGKGPFCIRYPRGSSKSIPQTLNHPITIGKGMCLRKGKHVALLALGNMVSTAWEVASLLEMEGIDASVYDMRFAKPLDTALLDNCHEKYPLICAMEDSPLQGGTPMEMAAYLHGKPCAAAFTAIGFPDEFIEHGSIPELMEQHHMTPIPIAQKITRQFRALILSQT
jgi:1-deoxy-D-xylulose-5-phosphate synthase